MSWIIHNPIAVVVSLLLHGLLAAVLLWAAPAKPPESHIKKVSYVQAKLVKLKAQTKAQKPAPKKPNVVDLTKKRKAQEHKKRLAEQKKKKQLAKKRAEEKRKKTEAERKRKQLEQEKKQRAEQERQAALRKKQEQEALAAAKAAEQLEASYANTAQSYMAAVKERIEANWHRPPSARKNMSCVLNIKLVPTGRVINVDVSKSSGSALFDRSAIVAVKKAEHFPELKNMPIEVFERYYRDFDLLFNPQDLRQ